MSARDVAAAVLDPELPVVTIAELGVLRDVRESGGQVEVTITPTYSGCPAMDAIRTDIADALRRHGYDRVEVRTVLAPAWTTDWISDEGRRKLREAGIAPPHPARQGDTGGATFVELSVRCPLCGSPDTTLVSRFGSTACKAIYTCRACREPFDHVKAI